MQDCPYNGEMSQVIGYAMYVHKICSIVLSRKKKPQKVTSNLFLSLETGSFVRDCVYGENFSSVTLLCVNVSFSLQAIKREATRSRVKNS